MCLVGAGGNVSGALTNYSALTGELATGGGYTAGGVPVTLVTDAALSPSIYFAANPSWAITATLAPYWALLYKVSNGDVVASLLLDSAPQAFHVYAGMTLTLISDSGSPIFRWGPTAVVENPTTAVVTITGGTAPVTAPNVRTPSAATETDTGGTSTVTTAAGITEIPTTATETDTGGTSTVHAPDTVPGTAATETATGGTSTVAAPDTVSGTGATETETGGTATVTAVGRLALRRHEQGFPVSSGVSPALAASLRRHPGITLPRKASSATVASSINMCCSLAASGRHLTQPKRRGY